MIHLEEVKMKIYLFFKIIFYLLLGYFTYLMILITWQYVPIDFEVAFLNIKQEEIAYRHYQIAFFLHVYTSIFVLIIGAFQFSTLLRIIRPKTHRYLGLTYIGLILIFASPSGLVMAIHANGGFSSKISFILQAILWFWFTYLAYKFARNKDWQRHQNFMLRSYALTLSAISLRLFKWGIIFLFELAPMDTYRIVSWLGWLFNLALIELIILGQKQVNSKI